MATKEVELAAIPFLEELQIVEEVLESEDAKKWEIIVQKEYNSFVINNIWSLVPLPKGRKPISCKWVFKIKHGFDGEVECYKAKFVARGFTQTFEVEYNETFTPVAKFVSIHCILAVTVIENMEIHQMDVKPHLLMGTLKKTSTWNNPKDSHKETNILCVSFKSLCTT